MISGFPGKKHTLFLESLMIIVAMAQLNDGLAQEPGEQLFQASCVVCHSIGDGTRIGPDLAGIHNRRSQEWLEKFVISSQSIINSGDAEAVAVFEDFNGIPMPDAPITYEQVKQVLSYVKAKSTDLPATGGDRVIEEPGPTEPVSMENVVKGQELFQGTTRFQNGGASCNACHHVKNDAVIGGGILAAELTTVFSRMGGTGVGAILGQAPFPIMQAAYKDNALTDDEITYLVAFLQNADEQHLFQQPRDYGIGLLASGALGSGLLYLLFAFIWRGRKKGSVNQEIYDRQIKSAPDNTNP